MKLGHKPKINSLFARTLWSGLDIVIKLFLSSMLKIWVSGAVPGFLGNLNSALTATGTLRESQIPAKHFENGSAWTGLEWLGLNSHLHMSWFWTRQHIWSCKMRGWGRECIWGRLRLLRFPKSSLLSWVQLPINSTARFVSVAGTGKSNSSSLWEVWNCHEDAKLFFTFKFSKGHGK